MYLLLCTLSDGQGNREPPFKQILIFNKKINSRAQVVVATNCVPRHGAAAATPLLALATSNFNIFFVSDLFFFVVSVAPL